MDGYRKVTPGFVRSGIHNVFRNLGEVPNLCNSLLQFKGQRLDSTGRLLINTTLGLASRACRTYGTAAAQRRLRTDPGLRQRTGWSC